MCGLCRHAAARPHFKMNTIQLQQDEAGTFFSGLRSSELVLKGRWNQLALLASTGLGSGLVVFRNHRAPPQQRLGFMERPGFCQRHAFSSTQLACNPSYPSRRCWGKRSIGMAEALKEAGQLLYSVWLGEFASLFY